MKRILLTFLFTLLIAAGYALFAYCILSAMPEPSHNPALEEASL